jgi:hypothetical protein
MAHPFHHSLSSVKRWGGKVEDYLELHQFFDQSKALYPGPQHRAMLHHSAGIFLLERCFGSTVTLSGGKIIPTRWVGEQHVQEDLGGRIPTFQNWLQAIAQTGVSEDGRLIAEPWMHREALALSRQIPEPIPLDQHAVSSLESQASVADDPEVKR